MNDINDDDKKLNPKDPTSNNSPNEVKVTDDTTEEEQATASAAAPSNLEPVPKPTAQKKPATKKTQRKPKKETGAAKEQELAPSKSNDHSWAEGEPEVISNKLLQWSDAILSLAPRLARLESTPNQLEDMHDQLCQIIKKVESNMHANGYRPQHTLATRYLLCALIDETILNSSWGKDSNWEDKSLQSVFQRDRWESKEFFQVLQHSAEQPHENIDFLELTYYALRLGFHGHHNNTEQEQSLKVIKDNLLQVLTQQRRDPTHKLFSSHDSPAAKTYKHPYPHISGRWVIVTVIVVVAIVSGVDYLVRYNMQKKLTQQLQTISQNIGHAHPTGENNAK